MGSQPTGSTSSASGGSFCRLESGRVQSGPPSSREIVHGEALVCVRVSRCGARHRGFLINYGYRAGCCERRPLALTDAAKQRGVADPQVSPDGRWIAYTVSTTDAEKDKRDTDVWMIGWDGADHVRLTSLPDSSESKPRWRPDGRYLAFIAKRGDDDEKKLGAQVWLLDWGTRRRDGDELALLDQLLDRCNAEVLVLEDPDAPRSERRPRRRGVAGALLIQAGVHVTSRNCWRRGSPCSLSASRT
jgi:hypothetical protein